MPWEQALPFTRRHSGSALGLGALTACSPEEEVAAESLAGPDRGNLHPFVEAVATANRPALSLLTGCAFPAATSPHHQDGSERPGRGLS